MRNVVKLIAFILLVIGTIGILINEFCLGWGWVANVAFADLNVLGLLILAIMKWLIRK